MPPAMDTRQRSPLRLLAPVALSVFVVAFFAILLGAGGDDAEEPSAQSREEARQALGEDADRREARQRRRESRSNRLASDVYVVKTGDTLGDIADKTGIPVEKLQELNTDLDPQALVSGQKIRLKE